MNRPVIKWERSDVYECHWDENFVGGPKTERHTVSYFTEDLGFTPEDLEAIYDLDEGEIYSTGGPIETLTITRLEYNNENQ